jgi:hypothetical protein
MCCAMYYPRSVGYSFLQRTNCCLLLLFSLVQVFEVVDGDEYVTPGTLRVTLSSLQPDHTGAFATKVV